MLSNKSDLASTKKFYATFDSRVPQAPLNSAMVKGESKTVVEKALHLIGYQKYLAQARIYKSSQRSVSQEFEREVQTQARTALSDIRTFGGSSLRLVKHMKSTGMIDTVLDRWQVAIKAAGSIPAEDVWNDILEDADAKRAFSEQGITGEMLAHATNSFRKFKPVITVHQGRLAIDIHSPSQAQASRIMFAMEDSGRPRTVGELLKQGQFDRIVESFDQPGGIKADITSSRKNTPIKLSEVALSASVYGVQELARHVRKLEDTGLATYQGSDPVSDVVLAVLIIGAILLVVGLLLELACGESDTACDIGKFLIVLGLVLLTLGLFAACAEDDSSEICTDIDNFFALFNIFGGQPVNAT